jgi:uncharacterized protein (TIGR04222 family)
MKWLLTLCAVALLAAACAWAAPFDKGTTPPPGRWPWPERRCDFTGTWLDAFNFLDLIPGPAFLAAFAVYAVLALLLCRWMQNLALDAVEPLPSELFEGRLPFTLKPNYLELAWLRGGQKAVLEAATCNLYRLDLIGSGLMPTRREPVDGSLAPIEDAVYQACRATTDPGKISMHPEVRGELERFESGVERKFRRAGFLPAPESWMVYFAFVALALLLIDGLGGIRLARSVMRGFHNVDFLIFMMVIVVIAALVTLIRNRSRFAARYLKTLQKDCKPALRRLQSKVDAPDDAESIYALAAFGAGALAGTAYAQMSKALQPPSSSSSCDGGGCGGGGCGGGGCGGG